MVVSRGGKPIELYIIGATVTVQYSKVLKSSFTGTQENLQGGSVSRPLPPNPFGIGAPRHDAGLAREPTGPGGHVPSWWWYVFRLCFQIGERREEKEVVV